MKVADLLTINVNVMKMYSLCMLVYILILPYYQCLGIINVSKQSCTREDADTVKCNYIPTEMNYNVSRVIIEDFENDAIEVISRDNFSSVEWKYVEYLEFGGRYKPLMAHLDFENNSFAGLIKLRDLRIHVNWLRLFPDTFVRLDNVTTLDLSSTLRLRYSVLVKALNGSNKVPSMQNLILSNWNLKEGSYAFNDAFIDILLPRKLSHIDISNSQISMLDIDAIARRLTYLEVLNGSYSTFEDISKPTQSDLQHIKMADFSYATFPKKSFPLLPGKILFSNLNYSFIDEHNSIRLILTSETVNLTGIVPIFTSIWLENCTIIFDTDLPWYTKHLILKQNNLKRLNVKTICSNFTFSSFELFDISNNGMEYLHPSMLHCMPNLRSIDLSKNQLHTMVAEASELFGSMFSDLVNLTYISLAANDLQNIPMPLFAKCKNVEVIDLSSNKLTQVTVTLSDLENLQTLDLSQNNIRILSSMSMNNLNSIPKQNMCQVIFKSNPLSCSECKAKAFLNWFTSSNVTDIATQTCIDVKGKTEKMSRALGIVQKICTRRTVILSTSITAGIVALLLVIGLALHYRRKKHTQRIQNRTNVVNRLREGEGQYEFVAYLAYSSADEDFVSNFVLNKLGENLQLMTGIERELVCTGDEQLRVGFDISSETTRCMEMSSVVLVVVSNSFCESKFCHNELNQAYITRKPIVLMFKEHVDEEMMMPTMKELYRKNVRMLWSFENGEYILKSTWDNVCTAILDLVKCDNRHLDSRA